MITIELPKTVRFEQSLSKEYRKVASVIANVRTGYIKFTVVFIKSAIPYSSVNKTAVYRGVSKITRIFEPNVLMPNNMVSIANCFDLDDVDIIHTFRPLNLTALFSLGSII